ncbi:MAG: ABC transporter ATP-binding protein, partial [Armatimonadetes bacterium]|nr:ABC transporter ATP-binding protein [Armatimonadota bacterium]
MRNLWEVVRDFGRPYVGLMVIGLLVMGATGALNAVAIKALKPVFSETFGALQEARQAGVEDSLRALASVPGLSPRVREAAGVLEAAVGEAAAARKAYHIRRLWVATLQLLGLFLAASIGTALSSYLAALVGQRLVSDVRRALFLHLEKMGLHFFEAQPVGELISRVTNDTRILQDAFSGQLANIVVGPLSAAAMLYYMVRESWRLSLMMCIAAPAALGVTRILGAGVRRHGRRAQARMAALSARIHETFAAIRAVKTFNLEARMAERFEDENRAVVRENLRLERIRAGSRPLTGVLAGIGVVATLLLGAHEILSGRLSAAGLMTFLFLAVQAGNFLSKFTQELISLHHADAAALRVREVLGAPPEPEDPPDAIQLAHFSGDIEFDHVTFSYGPDRPAVRDFCLHIRAGEHLAIVGPSGSGKTTIANLIARLYDPTEGVIRVDGVDLRRVARASYRRHIAVVSQDTLLFSGTVRENIEYGRPGATFE